MSSKLPEPSEGPVLFQARLKNEAEASGYHLNPDGSFVKMLAEGLLANRQRYGYPSCPCRLAKGDKKAQAVPERRHLPETRPETKPAEAPSGLAYPVWRCRVCGYLCGRDEAPDECPICKADKERFERFM